VATRFLKRTRILITACALTVLWTGAAWGQGPVVLMGIDGEDCGPDSDHGPITVYEAIVSNILSNVSNGGSGILVFGADGTCIQPFWNQIATNLSVSVTFVIGAANVTSQSFAGFAMLHVASDEVNMAQSAGGGNGGLTNAENDALGARSSDIAAFVNAGGGLLGFTSNLNNPYAYLADLGTFIIDQNVTAPTGTGFENITATIDGAAIGLTDDLDICCWHAEFLSFPSFMNVLATNADPNSAGNAAAVGGANVVLQLCGNGLIDPNEDCDDGNILPGDCCSDTCEFEASGSPCDDPSDTICDDPDTCDGAGTCQDNNEPVITVCRADVGECDVEELCDGAGSCPADAFETAGTACGDPSDTICDDPDTCDGSGSCQVNNEPVITVCRADVGECDVEELCDGAGGCPADTFETAGTPCGDPGDTICDDPDTCDGSGSCQVNNDADGTSCNDSNVCTIDDACTGGVCQGDPNSCGDGIVQSGTCGEECDDGNTGNGDGCENDCTFTSICGDGAVNQPGETCEPPGAPAGSNGNLCRGDCTVCGDSVLDATEACDDGNGVNSDGCENDCTPSPTCGDGLLNVPGETCDPPDFPAGGNGNLCRSDCTVCGDSVVEGGEDCDDGNGTDGDGCENSCTDTPICGDNDINQPSEECDGIDDVACPGTCFPPGSPSECLCVSINCGDSVIDPSEGEQCDPPLVSPNEVCNDNLDNDADGLVDCDDPDCPAFCRYEGMPDPTALFDQNQPCQSHRDCRKQFSSSAACVSQGTCGFNCRFANMCSRVDRDPALIRFGKKPGQLDLLTVHGRFAVQRLADPTVEGFEVFLANEHGIIYSGMLLRGEVTLRGKTYLYKDRAAKRTGGISLARVKYKVVKSELMMNFRVKAYGDFSIATEPEMMFRVSVGTEGGFNRDLWTKAKNGWTLFFIK